MRKLPVTSIAALLLLFAVVDARAQERPERPYRGLFGAGLGEAGQSLNVSGSLGGGWDDNVLADARSSGQGGASDANSGISGGVGQASGALRYGLDLERLRVGASAGLSAHYYPSLDSRFLRRYYANADGTYQITRDLSAGGGITYMPHSVSSFYQSLDASAWRGIAIPDIDFTSSLQHFIGYSADVQYSRPLSQRTTLGFNYDLQLRDSEAYDGLYSRHTAGGRLTYELGRGLALRAGYGYSEADSRTRAGNVHHHNIEAGVDYDRGISLTRHTTLSFSTGTAATTAPDDIGGGTRLRATGNVNLVHEIGRTWMANLGYARRMSLDDNWGDIVTSDSVSTSINGLLTRRLQFGASARASTGKVGLASTSNGFDAYYGGTSIGYALSRQINLSLGWTYYRHRFGDDVVLPVDFTGRYGRHSVRASVNVWAPLYQSRRRGNASR